MGSVNVEIERVSNKTTQEVGSTHLECARVAQPPANTLKRPYGDIRQRRRCSRIKIESIKVKTAQEVETTYLEHSGIVQPCRNNSKCLYKVIGSRRQCGRLKIKPIKVRIEHLNDKKVQRDEMIHLGCAHIAQPPRNPPNRRNRVHRTRRRRSHIKTEPRNVSRTQNGGRAYLGRINTIWLNWRPKRFNKLTFEYRKPGEPWRNDGDHG